MDPQERFNLFLNYLENPTSLSIVDRRGIFDRLTQAPQLFPGYPFLWPIRFAVEQEFAQGPLRLVAFAGEFNPEELDDNRADCVRIMQSGIFRKGELRASVRAETPKTCPLELEGFVRDLAGVFKSAWVHRAENLISCNLEGRKQDANDYVSTLEKALTSLHCVRNTRLAPIQKVEPIINGILDLLWDIKKNRHVLPKGLSESLTQQAKFFKLTMALAFILTSHVNIRKDPLAQRISELLTAFNYSASFYSTKKALQRSPIG
jgi:hypothetical protein